MTNPHGRESAGRMAAPTVSSTSHQLRWRDGGWARTTAAPPPTPAIYVAPEQGSPITAPPVGMTLTSPSEQQCSSAPRAQLVAILHGLARRLQFAGERAARPSEPAPEGALWRTRR